MKLKNLIITGFAALFTLVPFTVSAHEAALVDHAKLVSESDFSKIDEALWDTIVEHDVDVWIHTTESLNNLSIFNYTDQWYETYSSRNDGIVLVVCPTTRDSYIMTSGSCIYSFTDAGLDYIESQINPKMSKGDYAGAFITFAELCDDFMVQSAKGSPYDGSNMPKEPYNVGLSLLIALGVGLAVGGIGIFFLFSNLKSVHQQHGAADYKKPNSFHLDMHRDLFLYRKVSRKEKPQENQNGGSTTQTGSSGQTRGGSGSKF